MSPFVGPNTAHDVSEAFSAKWAHVPAAVKNPKRSVPVLDGTVAKFITGKITYTQACRKVPSSTLAWRLKALQAGRPLQKRGPKSVLTAEHEEQLMAWVTSDCLQIKTPYKNDILLQAEVMAHAHGLSFDTKNGLPSDKWFFGFRCRNKLSDRVVQHLAEARIHAAREVNIGEWYQSVRDELDQQHVTSAEQIFNMDEAGHSRCDDIYKGVAAARRRPASSIQGFCVCFFLFLFLPLQVRGLIHHVDFVGRWLGAPQRTESESPYSGVAKLPVSMSQASSCSQLRL